MRLDPATRPRIKHRGPPQLILGKIYVPIRRHRKRVCPADPRVPCENRDCLVGRVEDRNAVVFKFARVDEAVAVGFEAVRDAFLTVVGHGGFGHDFAGEATIAEARCGDRVEVTPADDAPVQGRSVRAKGDAVRAKAAVRDWRAGAHMGVDDFAPDEGGVAFLGAQVGSVVEVTPGFSGAEVDCDEAVAAFRARVGHVGDPLTGGCERGAEIEAHIVDVLEDFVSDGKRSGRIGGAYGIAKATFGGKTIVSEMVSFCRFTLISFGPLTLAGTFVPFCIAAWPVSSIHRRSLGS